MSKAELQAKVDELEGMVSAHEAVLIDMDRRIRALESRAGLAPITETSDVARAWYTEHCPICRR